MASFSVDAVFGIRQTFQTTQGLTFMNETRWRVSDGEAQHTEEWMDTAIARYKSLKASKFLANLPSSVVLTRIAMCQLAPIVQFTQEAIYGMAGDGGSLMKGPDENCEWRASACFVRKTFRDGRRAIGRYFHGPLLERFISFSGTVIDPILGGDLNDVISALIDPFTVTIGGNTITLKPIVCGPKPSGGPIVGVTSQDDVRSVNLSQYVSYLQTRKPGRGI
jgi:hypothetical protein